MPHISIMLIDDDEDDRDLFYQALMEIHPSCELKGFGNGLDAITLLNDSQTILPDLIFLDLNMPIINGLECLKQIRGIITLKNTPVIIYSTVLKLENEIAEVYQPVIFISKPYKFDEIVQGLRVIISNHLLTTR